MHDLKNYLWITFEERETYDVADSKSFQYYSVVYVPLLFLVKARSENLSDFKREAFVGDFEKIPLSYGLLKKIISLLKLRGMIPGYEMYPRKYPFFMIYSYGECPPDLRICIDYLPPRKQQHILNLIVLDRLNTWHMET